MRIHVVDPSAYTPPYDHALCRALGLAGAEVQLVTSRFAYGPVAAADGYERRELFYGNARGAPGSRLRRAAKLAEHVPDMLRYRRIAESPRGPDIVHFQWLTVQHLDGLLLPRGRPGPAGRSRPALVLTSHDVLPREPRAGQLAAQRRLYGHFDAIVVHSEHGRGRLVEELGVDPDRVHVILHGAFAHLTAEAVPPAPFASERLVVLCFGLIRPFKGIDVLLEAWSGIGPASELWIAGMARMDIGALQARVLALNAAADSGDRQGPVRIEPRFITDDELGGYFARADLVVLPYRQADQSGVLFTALAHGKPLLLSDVGGFPELARTGAARTVPAGDARALHEALAELLADDGARADMARCATLAARGPYSWESVAQAHLDLYARLGHRGS